MGRNREQLQGQRGAVSIFVVIFAALFFTAITVGFMMLMLSDQNRSTDGNLAKNALDSANAGVEDAKRVLAKYNDCVARNDTTPSCNNTRSAVSANSCNTIQRAIGSGTDATGKVVQQNGVGGDMQQAYTCVKVQTDTPDYTGTLEDGQVAVVPLRAKGGTPQSVKIRWTKADGKLSPGVSGDPARTGLSKPLFLPPKSDWKDSATATAYDGAVMRVQAIRYDTGSFKSHDVDNATRTAFLYPVEHTPLGAVPPLLASNIDLSNDSFDVHTTAYKQADPVEASDIKSDLYNAPKKVTCTKSNGAATAKVEGYRCEATVQIKSATDGYLVLASLYNKSSYQVTMYDGVGQPLKFDNVQPIIDSTGRANDVFKRVQARVNAGDGSDSGLYPRAALGARGSICKDYTITDYINSQSSGSGDPAEFDKGSSGTPACPDVTKNEFTP